MATGAFIFNIARGRVNELARLGLANDALVMVEINNASIQSDALLQDHATLAALLAANTECNFTGYGRRTLASVAVSVDNTANSQSSDAADPTAWTCSAGGVQVGGACIICYDDDTTGGTDTNLIPLVQIQAGTVTFDVGVPVAPVLNAAGFFTA